MGVKFFCDKCGNEVDEYDVKKMDIRCRDYEINKEMEAFMCEDCENEFILKIREIKDLFGF